MKENFRPDQQYVEQEQPAIGGFGIYGDEEGFERRSLTTEEEIKFNEAFGIGIKTDPSDEDFVVIQATPEQEALHVRAIAAHAEQMNATDAVKESIFDLPQDKFGLADPAREEKVIVDFNPQEYRREN